MADRDRDYYRKLFVETEQDPIEEADLDKLIEFISALGDRTEDDGELEDDYETMDPDDFLMKALGESGDGDGDEDEDDDDEEDDDWGGGDDEDEDADSVGGNAEDGKPDEGLPSSGGVKSDEGIKDTEKPPPKKRGKKDAGCVSDATVKNLAAALQGLRF